ncbi:hypothetical protein C8R26_11543 [Nitrosomonas oligotropha]|uniref:Surface-adhesin protein E-like domain-containing protein n=1 Tax=Nitrosomonas oligotropha TaxID=42354 RepID=A0A2T5HYI4_9PROT|nr:surface-adhesin E family protein [Nitrosomonas oligotropha]PTQ76644.1 hypothetical protein C8R26_11543 [Nitrosomonas oligotropha]TXI30578.1 MAG: hypothetical protein E6Q60_00985 [Nitrosomonas oligotropha]
MRKVFFGLTLMFVSTGTMAEWTRISESDRKGGSVLHADQSSLRKAAGRAKMAVLFDYQTLQKAAGAEFLSEKIRREYNCQEKQIRTLAYSLFSLNMEHGDLIRSYNQPQKWEMVKPDSLEEVEWKVACSE